MNTGVRITLLFTALLLVTVLVWVPWVHASHPSQGLWSQGWAFAWRPPGLGSSRVDVPHVATLVLGIALAGAAVTLALWNWPVRRARDPDA